MLGSSPSASASAGLASAGSLRHQLNQQQMRSKQGVRMGPTATIAVVLAVFLFVAYAFYLSPTMDVEMFRRMDAHIRSFVPRSARGLPLANYAVMIDAGSSGSRLYLYQYKLPFASSASTATAVNDPSADILHVAVAQDTVHRDIVKKQEPGLSAFAGSPAAAFDSIRPLLDFAAEHIPAVLLSRTPVYLLATAGMRLLPPAQQEAILTHLRAALAAESARGRFWFRDPRQVAVISGEQEGAFGWVALNYVLNRFGDLRAPYATGGLDPHSYQTLPTPALHPSRSPAATSANASSSFPSAASAGLVEVGGGSAQIAFELPPSVAVPASATSSVFDLDLDLTGCTGSLAAPGSATGSSTVTTTNKAATVDPARAGMPLGGHRYRVFTASFLGFGAQSARERYISALLKRAPRGSTVLADPCLLPGQRELVGGTHPVPWGTPLAPESPSSTSASSSSASTSSSPPGITLRGTGEWDKCRAALVPLLERSSAEGGALLSGQFQPSLTAEILSRPFYAFSEYWYSSRDVLGLSDSEFSPARFSAASAAFCASDFGAVLQKHGRREFPSAANEERLRQQCFKSAWLDTLLHDGHGYPRSATPAAAAAVAAAAAAGSADAARLVPVALIAGTEVQWSMGALLTMVTELVRSDPTVCQALARHDGIEQVRAAVRKDPELMNQLPASSSAASSAASASLSGGSASPFAEGALTVTVTGPLGEDSSNSRVLAAAQAAGITEARTLARWSEVHAERQAQQLWVVLAVSVALLVVIVRLFLAGGSTKEGTRGE